MVVARAVHRARSHKRSERGEQNVARILWWIGALVPGDEDRAVGAERGGGFDPGHLSGEEVVELADAVAGAARVVAVLAVVGDHEVEVPDGRQD